MARGSKRSIIKYEEPPSDEDPTLSDNELDDEQGGTSAGEQQAGLQGDSNEYSEGE